MNYEKLVGKIAADKDNNEIGRITNVEKLLGEIEKVYKYHALIYVKKFLRKPVMVPLAIDRILKIENEYVWFNISKKEFLSKMRRIKDSEMEREIYTGDTGIHPVKGNLGFAYDPYRLSRRGKERRK